jgi:hypothetical protein
MIPVEVPERCRLRHQPLPLLRTSFFGKKKFKVLLFCGKTCLIFLFQLLLQQNGLLELSPLPQPILDQVAVMSLDD